MNISTPSNEYDLSDLMMFKLDLEDNLLPGDVPNVPTTRESRDTPHPYLSVEIPEHFDKVTYKKLEETRAFIRELNARKFIALQIGNIKMASIYCRMLRNSRDYRDVLYNYLYKEDTGK